jgi:hypothetical protein
MMLRHGMTLPGRCAITFYIAYQTDGKRAQNHGFIRGIPAKRMARPVCKCFFRERLINLPQRIRSRGRASAEIEIRAPWSS